MKLQERLLEMTAGVRDQADAYASRAAHTARQSIDRAADRVLAAKTPVEQLAAASLRLNTLSSGCVQQLVSQQASVASDLLADGAQRLRVLAKATSLRDAWTDQVELFDATRARTAAHLQRTLSIVGEAGRNASELAVETYAGLVRTPAKARKPATRKAAAGKTGKPARIAKRKAA